MHSGIIQNGGRSIFDREEVEVVAEWKETKILTSESVEENFHFAVFLIRLHFSMSPLNTSAINAFAQQNRRHSYGEGKKQRRENFPYLIHWSVFSFPSAQRRLLPPLCKKWLQTQ